MLNLFLKAEKTSEVFIVDNRGPEVSRISVSSKSGKKQIQFTVKDDYHYIKGVQYSIDGAPWKMIYPVDSINDSKTETYVIQTAVAKTGSTHSIIIKAMDSIKNTGFGRTQFKD